MNKFGILLLSMMMSLQAVLNDPSGIWNPTESNRNEIAQMINQGKKANDFREGLAALGWGYSGTFYATVDEYGGDARCRSMIKMRKIRRNPTTQKGLSSTVADHLWFLATEFDAARGPRRGERDRFKRGQSLRFRTTVVPYFTYQANAPRNQENRLVNYKLVAIDGAVVIDKNTGREIVE